MTTTDDMELVQAYASTHSDSAFSEIVSRHLNLVYSSALRQVRDPHLAQEVTQAVFIILARKAASLGPGTILPGWLHRTTGFVSANALQAEYRRQRRETEASMENFLQNESSESVWQNMLPILDEALSRLRQTDRDALVLRYFENKSLKEVATALGLQERAAQKRVIRSLEKVRIFFLKRGVVVSSAALAGAVSSNSVRLAPAGLGAAILVAAKNSSAGVTVPLAAGGLKMMAQTKMKLWLAATFATAAVGTAIYVAVPTTLFSTTAKVPRSPGWILSGASASAGKGLAMEYRAHAEPLVIRYPGRLQVIYLPIQRLNSGRLNVSIAQDENGAPGPVIERFPDVLAPKIGETEELAVHSTAHPEMIKGTTYWLCAEPADAAVAATWFYGTNSIGKNYSEGSSPGNWTSEQKFAGVANADLVYENRNSLRGNIPVGPVLTVDP